MNNYITPGIDVDSLSVLVVDDVPLNILLIKKMLSQYTFEIRTANGGQAALDAIAQKKPNLVLLSAVSVQPTTPRTCPSLSSPHLTLSKTSLRAFNLVPTTLSTSLSSWRNCSAVSLHKSIFRLPSSNSTTKLKTSMT